ncbi:MULTISPECIES: CheR family methyltransferase [unclassified Undibacterium]|uniref:CheR family methyltransferase n=1 Tax=unclassified Undibacterium TaxID=2630295 RepID=UPI002AC923CC|nr:MULTISPECIES: CheR family methyltransferase [unclassified Undibacterium]MEB0138621.1 CheR family methyltransferase [Undibacterium sp. CCC2.1]MEB0171422.1 CheR family methyltransferase [Undibacterium sp. CCC1.1]MEB0175752.1 CheR family methyltransferase [Undibacterium sp. CCC3.4]MEB0214420.1 CheR family methyltransferase [Undibacterium sp. 5I2]WPX44285.1 CheR family methyltransferase [Undibacterium sp. CCC3.4]
MKDWLSDLMDLVTARTGLLFREHDSSALAARIAQLRPPYCSAQNWHRQLAEAAVSSAIWKPLLDLLTTGESYFFRDHSQIALLKEHLLPALIERRRSERRLRIWSAACASGEEAYSIAILLQQLLGLLCPGPAWDIHILATDINQTLLAKARSGIYSQWSFRRVDPLLQASYFTPHPEGWEIAADLRNMVQFTYGNLVEDQFPDSAVDLCDFDLIVCRNAFIYFHPETVGKVAQKLAGCLSEHGYLMTGHTELGFLNQAGLRSEWLNDLIVYRREPATTAMQTIQAQNPLPLPKPIPKPTQMARIAHHAALAPPQAASKTSNSTALTALLAQAKHAANLGLYRQASSFCETAITLDAAAAAPYFVLAQIAVIEGRREDSKKFLDKSLYLDPHFLAAHIELFHLHRQEGNHAAAEKLLQLIGQFLRVLPDDAIVPFYEELKVADLLHTLNKFNGDMTRGK